MKVSPSITTVDFMGAFPASIISFMAASATHVGPYRETMAVYEDLTNWVSELGYKTNGMSFQELIIDRRMTGDENKFVTKLYLPLNTQDI